MSKRKTQPKALFLDPCKRCGVATCLGCNGLTPVDYGKSNRELLAEKTLVALKHLQGGATEDDTSGGRSTNSPPASIPVSTTTGGVDLAEGSLGVKWNEEFTQFDLITSALARAKSAAQGFHGDHTEIGDLPEVNLCGRVWQVMAAGDKKDGGGPYFQWIIKWGGYTLKIADRYEPENNTPNVLFGIGSEPLMQMGIHSCWDEVKLIIEEFGGDLLWNKISRGDLCIDEFEASIKPLIDAYRDDRIISKARKGAEYEVKYSSFKTGRKSTGFTIGKGAIRARCYDKHEETKKNEVKRITVQRHRWGGVERVGAFRFEFQLRRPALRSLDCDTMEHFIDRLEGLCEYLCKTWIRFVVHVVKGKNHSKAVTMDAWHQVTEKFLQWSTSPIKHVERREPDCKIDLPQMEAQALGVLGVCCAWYQPDLMTPQGVVNAMGRSIENAISRIGVNEFMRRVSLKVSRVSSLLGCLEQDERLIEGSKGLGEMRDDENSRACGLPYPLPSGLAWLMSGQANNGDRT